MKTFRPIASTKKKKPADVATRSKRKSEKKAFKSSPEERATRPMREDLIMQSCLEAYGSVRHEGRLADRALDFTLRPKRNLYSTERRAVAERVYALLRRQRTVDWMLEHARPGFEAMQTSQKDVLRICASRVLHGESAGKVAVQASLSELDQATILALPEAASALSALPPVKRFPIAASLPDFLAAKFLKVFGARAEAEAEALNERAPLTIRTNTLKTDRDSLRSRLESEGVIARNTPLSPFGLHLETHLNAFSLPSFKDGLFEIQDEGSQILGMLVDAPPTRVVDACAGAGGKSLQLAAQMTNRGELFALDISGRRLEELKKRARRAGAHNIRIKEIAPTGPEARETVKDLAGKMDRVLVDAPCSGTGTFRRKPDSRYRLTEEMLADHVARQKDLLGRFSELVKPGGRVVYGTCSVLPEEDEAVVDAFLEDHPDFVRLPVADKLGEALAAKVSTDGYLRLTPFQHNTDGFFGTILQRRV